MRIKAVGMALDSVIRKSKLQNDCDVTSLVWLTTPEFYQSNPRS
jgi:hypothetical protein